MSESSNVNEPCHFLKTFYRNKATILKFLKFIFLLDPISAPLLHCYLQISIIHFNYIYIYIYIFASLTVSSGMYSNML